MIQFPHRLPPLAALPAAPIRRGRAFLFLHPNGCSMEIVEVHVFVSTRPATLAEWFEAAQAGGAFLPSGAAHRRGFPDFKSENPAAPR